MDTLIRLNGFLERSNRQVYAFVFTALACLGMGVLLGLELWIAVPVALVGILFIYSSISQISLVWILIVTTMAGQISTINIPDQTSLIVPISVMALIMASRIFWGEKSRIKSFLDYPVLLLMISALIFSPSAIRHHLTNQLLLILALGVFYFFIVDIIARSKKLWSTIWFFIITNSIIVMIGIVAIVLNINIFSLLNPEINLFIGADARLMGLVSNPNQLVVLTLFSVSILIFKYTDYHGLKRFFVLLCILLNVIGTAFTQSRAAMLGFLIGIFLLAFSNLRHRIYQILPILLIFVLAIFYIANNAGFDLAQRFTPEYLEETEQAGAIPRTVLFSTGLKIFMDNPWGHGFGSMHDLMYQNLGEEISVHNIFLELAIEHGILGLLASLWLAWLSTGRLWKILNRKEVDPETRWLAMGFFTIMVTIWINFLAHAFVAWIPLWIIFGMLAAFVYQAEQKKSMIHAG